MLATLDTVDIPLRISETPYFRRKHHELRPEVFKRKSVGSPANCSACHLTAEKGDYDEHKVKIPKQ
jgi:aldehyde:ferredoxin oxidoreductase